MINYLNYLGELVVLTLTIITSFIINKGKQIKNKCLIKSGAECSISIFKF